jgi:hypothetical protein
MIKTQVKNVLTAPIVIAEVLKNPLPPKAKYALSKLATACQKEGEAFFKERDRQFKEAGMQLVVDEKAPAPKEGQEPAKKWVHPDGDEKTEELTKAIAEPMLDADCELHALELDLDQFGDKDMEGNFVGLIWAFKEPK